MSIVCQSPSFTSKEMQRKGIGFSLGRTEIGSIKWPKNRRRSLAPFRNHNIQVDMELPSRSKPLHCTLGVRTDGSVCRG